MQVHSTDQVNHQAPFPATSPQPAPRLTPRLMTTRPAPPPFPAAIPERKREKLRRWHQAGDRPGFLAAALSLPTLNLEPSLDSGFRERLVERQIVAVLTGEQQC